LFARQYGGVMAESIDQYTPLYLVLRFISVVDLLKCSPYNFTIRGESRIMGLFKNVQIQGAQKTETRGVYRYTLSDAVCSATQQMNGF
jgi:hypothetical protein